MSCWAMYPILGIACFLGWFLSLRNCFEEMEEIRFNQFALKRDLMELQNHLERFIREWDDALKALQKGELTIEEYVDITKKLREKF